TAASARVRPSSNFLTLPAVGVSASFWSAMAPTAVWPLGPNARAGDTASDSTHAPLATILRNMDDSPSFAARGAPLRATRNVVVESADALWDRNFARACAR